MFRHVVLKNGHKTTDAYIPSGEAHIGNVVTFAGEYGWTVAQTGVYLPQRFLPGQLGRAGNERFTSSEKA